MSGGTEYVAEEKVGFVRAAPENAEVDRRLSAWHKICRGNKLGKVIMISAILPIR